MLWPSWPLVPGGLVPGANYGRDYAVFETVSVWKFVGSLTSSPLSDILELKLLSLFLLFWGLSGHKEHREEYCGQEHRQSDCHAASQLHDAGSSSVSSLR